MFKCFKKSINLLFYFLESLNTFLIKSADAKLYKDNLFVCSFKLRWQNFQHTQILVALCKIVNFQDKSFGNHLLVSQI